MNGFFPPELFFFPKIPAIGNAETCGTATATPMGFTFLTIKEFSLIETLTSL